MAAGTATVDCPRCDDKIKVAIELAPPTPKPGAKIADVDVHVLDLADRFAEHYQAAGHTGECP